MKMSFYEDKTAEILSKVNGIKCFVVSTALTEGQKEIIKKKINNIEYIVLPNNNPEVFDKKFSILLSNYIKDSSKNYFIFNQFYKLDKDLFNFKLSNFLYSIHCPFSANFSNKSFILTKLLHNFIYFPVLFKKYLRELVSINQIRNRKKSSIIYSSEFVKNYYSSNILYYFLKSTLKKKGIFIPLCIKKKQNIKNNKFKKLEKNLKKYKLKVCFIGRVTVSKGIDHILNFSRIFKYNDQIIFYIAGATDLYFKKKLIKFKKKNKIRNLILNLDGVDNEDVCSLYSLFDASFHLSNVPEGTSYSIMESMISKCVPIANYSSEMISNNCGYVLENFKYHQIEKILSDHLFENNLKKLKTNTSAHIKKNYNEKVLIKKYKKVLSI